MIQRETYLRQLQLLKDVQLIKVVTGLRRSGKSTLLEQFRQELLNVGIPGKCTQTYNLENPDYSGFDDWKKFYDHIKRKLVSNTMNYVFLDEIQMIDNFERLLDGLHLLKNTDVYVTGSNAYLLSGELATILTGRSIAINMYPFSFAEYVEYLGITNANEINLADYIQTGGLPQALELKKIDFNSYVNYLNGLLTTIIEKDIKTRNKIYNDKSFNDVTRFLADSIGSSVSSNSIAKAFKNLKVEIDDKTITRYISVLNDSFVFYPVQRFDIKGKNILKTNGKQYIADTGFRNVLLGRTQLQDTGHLLENIVYFELLRRGNTVWIGKSNKNEIDFVVKNKQGYIQYYQVTVSMRDENTRNRELAALNSIKDHNPKTIISLDPEEPVYDGIVCRNAIKWLLEK
ncbi:MAG: ATP-binding protein [Cyclobacteriaceae bacterium]|nr:ATP-binding protein [Cyclobacteriaceae bacterium]